MIAITGATSGIGFELAKQYCRDKNNVLIIGRNEDRLKEQQDYLMRRFRVRVEYMVVDLTNDSRVREVFWEIKLKNYLVDIFINCAGFGLYGDFKDLPQDQEIDMIKVNAAAVSILTKDAINYYREKKIKGKVLNIASVGAHVPLPYMAVYGATKAYVRSFSQAVNKELKESGSPILVSVMFPPAVETKFISDANAEEAKVFQDELLSAKKVASIAIKGLSNRRENIYCRTSDRIKMYFINYLPLKMRLQIINVNTRRK